MVAAARPRTQATLTCPSRNSHPCVQEETSPQFWGEKFKKLYIYMEAISESLSPAPRPLTPLPHHRARVPVSDGVMVVDAWL